MAADFVTTAGQNTDNAKAQALNNIAQTGQSQSQAFGQAAQNDAAAKTAALKTAMAMAALRGAPAGNVQQGQSTISAPLDQRATTLDTIKGNYAQNNDATNRAFGSYFDVTKAGLPIAQERYKQTAAGLQEKAAERAAVLAAAAQSRQTANDLAAMRLQLEQQRLDKQSAPETLGQFISRNGGADLVGDQLKSALDQAPTGADQISQVGGGHPAAGVNAVTDPMRDSLPDIVGGTPISPSLARTLMTNSEQKDNAQANALARGSLPTAESIRQAPSYQSGTKDILDTVNGRNWDPKLYGTVVSSLTAKYGADVARQLVADNASLFRAKGVNPTNLGF